MLKNILLAITFSLLLSVSSFSQNSKTNQNNYYDTENILQYKFNYIFREKVYNIYKVTFDTQIHRKYSDDIKQNFSRKKEIFITLRNPTALKDGFALINTGIDSIRYQFSDGKQVIKWDSQNDDIMPKIPDFDETFATVGRFFVSNISPYFEVARLDGNLLEQARANLNEVPDSTLKIIWSKAISDNNLKLYTDPNKNVIRNGRFAQDSSWKMQFSIPIEGITYTCDTANVKFYLYDAKNFHVKAEMPYMKPNQETASVAGLNRVLLPVDAKSYSKGYWDISFSPFGDLNIAEGEFTTEAYRTYQDAEFKDDISTKIKFELIKTYRWTD